jgi:hypothetical protein
MAYAKNIPTPYHQQDTGYYCGAASAQMVLDAVGAGLLDQSTLYTDTHDHTTWDQNLYDSFGQHITWSTNPDGLQWTLNHYNNPPNWYLQYPLDWSGVNSEDAASRKIAWTIHHYPAPPCALVQGGAHWVVVHGMELSAAPTSSGDTSYTINSFRINNPWPPVPSSSYWTNPSQPPPPPHSATDGCGGGGNRGVADEVISYAQWQSTYLTAANYHPQGHWQGLFVAICDPEPPATRPGPRPPRLRRFEGRRIIPAAETVHLVSDIIKRRILPDDARWTETLRNAKPAHPLLVHRLDRQDDHYYIVPMAPDDRGATAAMIFDARFGEFHQAVSLPGPEPRLVHVPTNEQIHSQIADKSYELDRNRGYVQMRGDLINILNHWFWKPCLESLSPFWPFKMAFSGSNLVYLRIDGQVFTDLHTNILGI